MKELVHEKGRIVYWEIIGSNPIDKYVQLNLEYNKASKVAQRLEQESVILQIRVRLPIFFAIQFEI